MLNIQKIHPKIKWHRTTRDGKNLALLLIDSMGLANYKNYSQKLYKINYQVQYYRQLNASRWISEKDYRNLVRIFKANMEKDLSFLYQMGATMESKGKTLIKSTAKYKDTQWSKLSNKNLIKILEKFNDAISQLWGGPCTYGWYFFFNDIYLLKFKEILKKKLKDSFKKIWDYLLIPEKITFIGQEKIALLKLAKSFIKNRKISREKIKKHLKIHAFTNKDYYWGRGFTFKALEKRIKELRKIKGKVRIVASDKQVKNFRKGEILVTQMTNPTYLPAIQKASAIVTDEGGLLCHAAIVSRELKIPCIIGTKIATKALKDGMMVEVDADKGAVKIIK